MNNTRKPISCVETTWLVSDGCERMLTQDETQDLVGHIESCSLCQGASKQFEVLFRQVKAYFGTRHEVQ